MGNEVKAICKCGLNKKILIGGGRMSYLTTDYFPCLCEDCKDIVQVNILDYTINPTELVVQSKQTPLNRRILTCEKCSGTNLILYNDPILIGEKGNEIEVQDYDLILTNGTYKCPRCSNMTLKFINTWMFWD